MDYVEDHRHAILLSILSTIYGSGKQFIQKLTVGLLREIVDTKDIREGEGSIELFAGVEKLFSQISDQQVM